MKSWQTASSEGSVEPAFVETDDAVMVAPKPAPRAALHLLYPEAKQESAIRPLSSPYWTGEWRQSPQVALPIGDLVKAVNERGRGRPTRDGDRCWPQCRYNLYGDRAGACAVGAGERVILVDLALHAPNLSILSTDPNAPGFAELVRGTASFGDIITRDKFSKVHLIAAGNLLPGRPQHDPDFAAL